jgi:cellobiose-specific phosphotransferase system component IIA
MKQHALERKGGRVADLLTGLTEQTALTRSRQKEVREALAAGQDAAKALLVTRDLLRTALDWSKADVLFGSSIVTALKQGKLEKVNRSVHTAQQRLSRFHRELDDVKRQPEEGLEVNLGSFLTVADYLFDGLIIDCVVHSRIEESGNRLEEVTKRVREILARLEKELTTTEADLAEAETARRELIQRG